MPDPNLIEDLRRLHPPPWQLAWYGLAALALATLVWWFLRRQSRRPSSSPSSLLPDPAWLAWDNALLALEQLGARLDPHRSREYGIAVTDILRTFIQQRFHLDAPCRTSLEFLELAHQLNSIPPPARDSLRLFLQACDWMKFGLARAESTELRSMHETAIAFVTASRPASERLATNCRSIP